MKKILLYIIAITVMASCGSSKKLTATGGSGTTTPAPIVSTTDFMYKVSDNSVYAKNIVAGIDFTMNGINVGGKLFMKKDDVIRVQLVAFGLMEVGRLEFTKEYVLIQDKMHKQFMKEDYNRVEFLKQNGLDFYALQALLWNNLYIPGKDKVSDSALKEFDVKPQDGTAKTNISLNRGDFLYKWTADNETALLEKVEVNYKSMSHGSTNVNCNYSKFVPMGSTNFPTDLVLELQTTSLKSAKSLKFGFSLHDIKNTDDWETRTTPSSKYKHVSVEEMLGALMSIAN